MPGLRALCQERVEKGEAAQLIDPLLDLIEQLSDRLLVVEARLGKLLHAQYGRRSEQISAQQLQLGLMQLEPKREDLEQLLVADEIEPQPRTRPARKRTCRQIPASIPRRLIISEPSEAQLQCSECGSRKVFFVRTPWIAHRDRGRRQTSHVWYCMQSRCRYCLGSRWSCTTHAVWHSGQNTAR